MASSTASQHSTAAPTTRTPAQWFATLAGVVLVVAGIIGFFWDAGFDTGSSIEGDAILGILEVNGIHNLVHLASGLLLLAVARKRSTARLGVLAFGLVYALVTLIGLVDGETVLGLIPVNGPDNVLHILLTGAALLAAFSSPADDRR